MFSSTQYNRAVLTVIAKHFEPLHSLVALDDVEPYKAACLDVWKDAAAHEVCYRANITAIVIGNLTFRSPRRFYGRRSNRLKHTRHTVSV